MDDLQKKLQVIDKLGPYYYPEKPQEDDKVKRELRAEVFFPDGTYYEGEWSIEDDMFDGRGKGGFKDGSFYEGYWK